ncbi:MAG: hypothetical protein PVTTEEND_001102 [Candidatus Fervidibacter sp.]|jgi:hypothetical protein
MWQAQTKEAILREVRIRQWRAQVSQKVKVALIAFGTWLVARLKGAVGWLRLWSATTAKEIEVSRRLSQRHDKLLQIGERAYTLYRSGNLSWEALLPLCKELEGMDKELDAFRQQPFVLVAEERQEAQSATGS